MEKKYAGGMNTPITVSRCELLKDIHIPELEVIVGVDLVTNPGKKTCFDQNNYRQFPFQSSHVAHRSIQKIDCET